MSTNLNQAAILEFDNLVKDLFQGMSMLKPFVDKRLGVIGSSYEFLSRSVTEAQLRGGAGSALPLVNNIYARPIALLQDWVWSTGTDIFQQKQVNFDEISSLADVEVKALGRRVDKIIINAANAATLPAGNIIATGAANLTFAKLLNVLQICDSVGIPYNEVTVAISAKGLSSLLKDDHVTNYFYTDVKPLATGSLRQFLGMNIVTMPDNSTLPPDGSPFTGSLPLTGTVRTAYAFHKRAVGYAESEISTRVDYAPLNASYITNAPLRAGAVAVDPTGIISISYDESL